MKCLDNNTSENWLAESGIQIAEHRQLKFPHEQKRIVLTRPEKSLSLNYFAERLMDWFPKERDKLIWLSHWETYPSNQIQIVEKIRLSYGEYRPIIESPGFLFDETIKSEDATAIGLLFLMMSFDWSGYIITKRHPDYIYIFDSLILFSCSTETKAQEIINIADKFKLKVVSNESVENQNISENKNNKFH